MTFPTGPWRVWVCREGLLVVTEGSAPAPKPGAWPVAAESSHERAMVACLRFGRQESADRILVEPFAGTIGAAVRLQKQIEDWQRATVTREPRPTPAPSNRGETLLDEALA